MQFDDTPDQQRVVSREVGRGPPYISSLTDNKNVCSNKSFRIPFRTKTTGDDDIDGGRIGVCSGDLFNDVVKRS